MTRTNLAPFVTPLALAAALLSPTAAVAQWPSLGWFSSDSAEAGSTASAQRPGDPAWWRSHKSEAVFDVGRGWRVPGFEGYFDRDGRPIDAPVDELSIKLGQKKQDTGMIPALDPRAAANKVKETFGHGADETAARALYERGVQSFNDKHYAAAITKFKAAAQRWPGTMLEAKAMFALAEARYFGKEYDKAMDAYVDLLTKHPNTPRLDASIERLWAIARYWEKYNDYNPTVALAFNAWDDTRPAFDTIGHAVKAYEAIRLNDPTGPRADDAIMATAGIYFRRERYFDADYHYELLRRDYPRSEHQFEAHLLGLQSKMRMYQGPDYDGTPLEEGQKLAERIRTNFAGRLTDVERQRLTKTRAELAALIEARDLRMAEYYHNIDHNASAKIYLKALVEKDPDSPAAAVAKQRLAELGELPPRPEQPLGWFVGMFPQNDERKALDEIVEIAPGQDLAPGAGQTMVAENPGGEPTTTR
ncbi:Outer membrane protein assembly factor BamD [Pseudobythopirellula maris]|uniref:Outer membrane protein assembly factor BamD n=1 Tax=Pseudobythopirellula maris TaxID=2527991 RepID=A0A5C5ZL84_9BACT|nr:outer membrane protein assembly factor BamD [Pseudobythopirellula maris]TWT88202.1 Outer membrane protein assembly factor BamD [Pseudobythopirellula maris]